MSEVTSTWFSFGAMLCDILKVRNAKRIVIDVQIDQPVIVYIQRFLDQAETDKILDLVTSPDAIKVQEMDYIDIDDQGNVTVI